MKSSKEEKILTKKEDCFSCGEQTVLSVSDSDEENEKSTLVAPPAADNKGSAVDEKNSDEDDAILDQGSDDNPKDTTMATGSLPPSGVGGGTPVLSTTRSSGRSCNENNFGAAVSAHNAAAPPIPTQSGQLCNTRSKAPPPPPPPPSVQSILNDPETNDWMAQSKGWTKTNITNTAVGRNCPNAVTASEPALSRKLIAANPPPLSAPPPTTKTINKGNLSSPPHQNQQQQDLPLELLVGRNQRGGSVLHKTQIINYSLENGGESQHSMTMTQFQRHTTNESSLPGAIPVPGPAYQRDVDDDDYDGFDYGHEDNSGAHHIRMAPSSEASSDDGMDIHRGSGENNSITGSAVAFEPEKPVQATLVSPHSSEVFTAHPMTTTTTNLDLEATTNLEGERSNGGRDVMKNPRIRYGMFGMCGLMVLLVVGLSVGLAISSRSSPPQNQQGEAPHEDTMVNSNFSATASPTTTTTVREYPPFAEDFMLPPTIESIVKDPFSVAGRANAWIWEDPHREDYSIERQLFRFGLVAIYYSLNGDNWHRNDGWLDYELHECEWYSSQPDGSCFINGGDDNNEYEWYATNLSNNALSGMIPLEIFHLKHFHTIVDLHNNSIRGNGPPLRNEGKMAYLDVSDNQLDGPVTMEAAWSNKNVWYLNASHNLISGVIPTYYIESIPNLRIADFSHNRFSGDFPDTFPDSESNNLKLLNVAGNQLKGEVPPSLIKILGQLDVVDISGNENLVGSISDWRIDTNETTNNFTLSRLDISGTALTGSMPANLCDLQAMGELRLRADCDEVECCSED